MSETLPDIDELERRRLALIRELEDTVAEGKHLASGTLDVYVTKGLPVWARAILNTYAEQNQIGTSAALAEMVGYFAQYVGVPQNDSAADSTTI